MRLSLAAFASLTCVFTWQLAIGQDAFVTLRYSDDNAEERRYFITPAEDGSYNLAKKFVIAPDLDGYVRLRIKLKKPGFVYTSGLNQPLSIYVEPLQHVNVRVEETILFTGDLRKENTFINGLKLPPHLPGDGMDSLATFQESLRGLINSDASAVRSLLQVDRKTARAFNSSLPKTRAMRMLNKADSLIGLKLERGRASGYEGSQYSEWASLRATLFVDSLLNCGLIASKDYAEYLMRYVNYIGSPQGYKHSETDSLALARYMKLADEHLADIAKETYMSMFLSSNIAHDAPFYGRDLILFYEKFAKEFPKSAAIPVLEPEMKRIAKIPLRAKN